MNDLESSAWLHLVTVFELLPAALDAQLRRDAGLTHFEFVVLSVLRFTPGSSMRMKPLAAAVAATLPRLSHVVARLEGRGLVERLAVPGDGRATEARLTDEGRRTLVLATPGHIATVRRLVFDVLDEGGVERLDDVAGRIARGLDPGDRFALGHD